jgi:hypothetical protein
LEGLTQNPRRGDRKRRKEKKSIIAQLLLRHAHALDHEKRMARAFNIIMEGGF